MEIFKEKKSQDWDGEWSLKQVLKKKHGYHKK